MCKKFVSLFVFLCAFIQGIYSNDSISSKIVFYREANLLAATRLYKIYVNDSLIVRLRNSSYYEYSCAPGDYLIEIKSYGSKINLHVEEGKTAIR